MLTMNYVIALPKDYDMQILRDRVANLGSTYDRLDHLTFKAFLITEEGVDGNKENSYSPFYVWQSESGIHEFLSGEKYKGLTHAFGWMPVRLGIVHTLKLGHVAAQPKYAIHEKITIAPHTDLSELWATEEQLQEAVLHSPHAFLNVVSFEPTSWTLVRFTLWDQLPEERCSHAGMQCLKLLHLATPQLASGGL